MKHSRRLRSILRTKDRLMPRIKNFRLHVFGLNETVAQPLDGETMPSRYPIAAMPPTGNQRGRHAKLIRQTRGPVGVYKVGKCAHSKKFSKSKDFKQAESLGYPKDAPLLFGYPKVMNIPWGKKVKARLKELRRTQVWLANEIGASEPTVSQWLKGVHNPHITKLIRIAELLDMTLAELIENDDAIAQDMEELALLRAWRMGLLKQNIEVVEIVEKSDEKRILPPPPPE